MNGLRSIVMNSRKEELSKTISMLELELEYMHKFLNYVPAPCIVYTKDGRISW